MRLVERPGFGADHDDFTRSVRRFLADQVVEKLDAWRAEGRFGADLFPAAGEQGFLATTVAEDLGGAGIDDPRFAAVLVEELAATGATGLALVVARHLGVVLPALAAAVPGAEERVGDLVRGLSDGSLIGCVAVLGADLRAAAVPGADVADVFVVLDRERPDRLFVLDRNDVDVVASRLLGGAEAAVGDVAVAAGSVTGEGLPAEGTLAVLDLWTSIVSLAAAAAAFDLTLDYVRERSVFGRPLSTFENTRFRLAELGAELAAARGLVDSALTGTVSGMTAAALAASARVVAASVHDRVVDQGMQLHGGYGYMREYPIAHAFGDARFLRTVATGEPRVALAVALSL